MQKIVLFVLILALSACSAPAPAVTPTITSTPPPTLTATATFTATLSPTPTLTPTPDPLAGLPEAVRAQIEAGNIYNAEKGYVANPDGRMMSLLLPSGEWKTDFEGSMHLLYSNEKLKIVDMPIELDYYAEPSDLAEYLINPESGSGIVWNAEARESLRFGNDKRWWQSSNRGWSALLKSTEFEQVELNRYVMACITIDRDGKVTVENSRDTLTDAQYNSPYFIARERDGKKYILFRLFDFRNIKDGYYVTQVMWPGSKDNEGGFVMVAGDKLEVLRELGEWAETVGIE